jgi:ankyrin repeat protein
MASPSASSATLSIHSDEYEDDAQSVHISNDDELSIVDLPEEYTRTVTEYSLAPSMKAAANPDFNILKAVLSRGYELSERRRCDEENPDPKILDFSSEFSYNAVRSNGRSIVGITTPLMEAIRAQLPANVKILLDAGANPNGVPYGIMDDYAALFLRFRPSIKDLFNGSTDVASRYVLLRNMNLPQISSLTVEEVEDRFYDGIAPFWCEENFTQSYFWTHGETMPSLVQAAKSGSIEIFEMLLNAGVDASFWLSPQFYVPDPATESSLSVSSPLHAAIEAGNGEIVEFLLQKGFDPNTMPLANPTRCVTPLMSTIVHCSSFNKEAFDILSQAQKINFELRTPVYGVHILHFAVARLDLEMLKYVAANVELGSAGETALGHSLLHVACMPADTSQVQRHADIICKSIHETRDLRPFNDINSVHCASIHHPDEWTKHLKAQAEVVKYLWRSGVQDFGKRDVHGNTALHYLAGCRAFNQELLHWLLSVGGSELEWVWKECYNIYGACPMGLEAAGKEVRRVRGDVAEIDFDRHWSKARAHRKAETWRELLEM